MASVEAYLRAKFHLDPSNRLARVHERCRQTGRQRTDSIGRTVLQTVAQKALPCYYVITTYLIVRTTISQRQVAERTLENFTDELRFPVVECDTGLIVSTLTRALLEILVHRLRHVGVDHRAEPRRLRCRANDVKVDDPRCGTPLKSHKFEQVQQEEKEISYLVGHRHVICSSSARSLPNVLRSVCH